MTTKGLFHGEYETVIQPLTSDIPQYGGRAYVIPGQGAAFNGMFADQLKTLERFRERFAAADQLSANFDLLPISLFITRPAALPLDQIHIYRNCAIFTAEVAMGEYLIDQGLKPDVITAHSFGECAAMVLSGLIDFDVMYSVVMYRNLLAPPANVLGLMVAVSGNDDGLKELLQMPGVYLANRNSHKQLVISVATEAKLVTLEKLRKSRIAHVILQQLPQPYHSPLMNEFRDKLHDRLSQMKIKAHAPRYDLYSGVTHSWIGKDNYQKIDFVDILARQATEPVDFVDQLHAISSRGITSFYEVGPGRMLETSIRSVLRDRTIAYKDTDQLLQGLGSEQKAKGEAIQKLARSKWFDKIKTAIQSVTGYKTEEIDISFSFQNDLGIDSIKKAEILFKIINDRKINSNSDFSVARFSTIYQAVDYLENYSDTTDPIRQTHTPIMSLVKGDWRPVPRENHFVFESKISEFSVLRLRPDLDTDLIFLDKIREFSSQARASDLRPLVILELKSQIFDPDTFISLFHEKYAGWLARGPAPRFDLAIVDLSGNEYYRPIASFWKSLRKETGHSKILYCTSDQEISDRDLILDFHFSTLRDLRYQNGIRYIREYVPVSTGGRFVRQNPVLVVAVGGSRGINFEVLKNFPVVSGDRLVLVGRSPIHRTEVSANLETLKKHWPLFTYVTADASKYEELSAAIRGALKDEEKIDFLFNACGYEVSQSFDAKDRDEIKKEFRGKWIPFQNLERFKKENGVEKLIHYSSVVTEFGSRGQAVYAFSNGLIDRACAQSGSYSLAWGPWENSGMTENLGIQQRLKEWGLSFVSSQEGCAITYRILFGGKSIPHFAMGFDTKDIFLFTTDRDSLNDDSPVAGTVQNAFEASFIKDIDLEREPFLKDHSHAGKPLIPASYLIATFASIAKAQFGRTVSITNFEIQNPLLLEEGHSQIKLQAFFREPHFAQIYSVIPHCSANFDPEYVWARPVREKFDPVDKIDIHAFSKSWVLEVGPKFKLLQNADVDKTNRVRLDVDTAGFPKYLGDTYFDFILGVVEVAFESFTIQANLDVRSVTVPMSCERIAFAPNVPFTRFLKIRPVIAKNDGKYWSGDVDVETSEGEIVCCLIGVRTQVYGGLNTGDLFGIQKA